MDVDDDVEDSRKKVKIRNQGRNLVEFDFDFDEGNVDLRGVKIEKQKASDGKGSILVRGLKLNGKTKSLFI